MQVRFPVTPPVLPNYRVGIKPTEPSQVDFNLMPVSLFIQDESLSFGKKLFSCNESQESKMISVQRPSNQFANLLEQNFYSIKNANLTFLDTNYHCDIYTSREMVTMEDVKDRELLKTMRRIVDERISALDCQGETEHSIATEGLRTDLESIAKMEDRELLQMLGKIVDKERLDALDYQGEIEQSIATEGFRTDLERIAKSISKDGIESEALYALSFLQHVAKQGKKIVVVQSHGGTDYGLGRWISAHSGKSPIYVDDILEAIHQSYSSDEVGAIYLELCNPDGFPIDFSKVSTKHKIPIVAHTNFNHPEIADVKLYLPV